MRSTSRCAIAPTRPCCWRWAWASSSARSGAARTKVIPRSPPRTAAMKSWFRYLKLQAEWKTGLSAGLFVSGLVAVLCGAVTFGFVVFAAFIWLAERYGPLPAALLVGAFFLLGTVVAMISCLLLRRRTAERARLELAARRASPWLDPRLLGVGLQVSRSIGARKLIPLLAVGFFAAALGMQALGRDK